MKLTDAIKRIYGVTEVQVQKEFSLRLVANVVCYSWWYNKCHMFISYYSALESDLEPPVNYRSLWKGKYRRDRLLRRKEHNGTNTNGHRK